MGDSGGSFDRKTPARIPGVSVILRARLVREASPYGRKSLQMPKGVPGERRLSTADPR